MAASEGNAGKPAAARFRSFAEFWPFYVRQHRAPHTRLLHFAGTGLGLVWLVATLALGPWWLALATPVIAYGFAWSGHAFVERNKPATFTYPLWSLRGDMQMFALMLRGRMDEEVRRLR